MADSYKSKRQNPFHSLLSVGPTALELTNILPKIPYLYLTSCVHRLLNHKIVVDGYALHDGPYFFTSLQPIALLNGRQVSEGFVHISVILRNSFIHIKHVNSDIYIYN